MGSVKYWIEWDSSQTLLKAEMRDQERVVVIQISDTGHTPDTQIDTGAIQTISVEAPVSALLMHTT